VGADRIGLDGAPSGVVSWAAHAREKLAVVRARSRFNVRGEHSNGYDERSGTMSADAAACRFSDPVGAGFVASVPRPGGNITGFTQTDASVICLRDQSFRMFPAIRTTHALEIQGALRPSRCARKATSWHLKARRRREPSRQAGTCVWSHAGSAVALATGIDGKDRALAGPGADAERISAVQILNPPDEAKCEHV